MPQLDAPVAHKVFPTVVEGVEEARRVVDGEHMAAHDRSLPIPAGGTTKHNGPGRLAG